MWTANSSGCYQQQTHTVALAAHPYQPSQANVASIQALLSQQAISQTMHVRCNPNMMVLTPPSNQLSSAQPPQLLKVHSFTSLTSVGSTSTACATAETVQRSTTVLLSLTSLHYLYFPFPHLFQHQQLAHALQAPPHLPDSH